MAGLGRYLIFIGFFIVLVGALILIAGKFGLPLGHLPGDFSWRGKNSSFYFPLATCLLISAALSLLLYVIGHIRR